MSGVGDVRGMGGGGVGYMCGFTMGLMVGLRYGIAHVDLGIGVGCSGVVMGTPPMVGVWEFLV